MAHTQDIKIGTLVRGGATTAEYIRQISSHGFESYSIMFWQETNIDDWQKFAAEVLEACRETGAVISSLGMFGNPLESDEKDLLTLQGWRDCIDHAHLFGCDIVSGFTGRVRGKAIHEGLERYTEIWEPLAERAEQKKVKIAFENCDMGGDWSKGDWNMAHNPQAWELMFDAVPGDHMGLEWEPCHQMVSLIEPLPQLKKWAHKVFHVHGKDATIHWDVVKEYGVDSLGAKAEVQFGDRKFSLNVPLYVEHRTPGFGDSNWTDIITELRRSGFKGSIDIEGWHDPIYRGDLEMTGQVKALNYLKSCRGGDHVPNPSV